MSTFDSERGLNCPIESAKEVRRIWRLEVEAAYSFEPVRSFFVDAGTEQIARDRVTEVVAVMEGLKPQDVSHRILSCQHSRALMEHGAHPNVVVRMFETRAPDGECRLVAQPVFLLTDPAVFCKTWALAALGELGPAFAPV